jgi:hypothetical protein
MDMAPLIQTSSQLQVSPLVPRSTSIIPNLYQFKAKVECPIFVVNPPPTLHVFSNPKKQNCDDFLMAHPHMNQPLQMFY